MADVVLESDNAMSRGLSKIHKRDNPKIPGRKIEARQISPLGNSLVAPFERKKAKKWKKQKTENNGWVEIHINNGSVGQTNVLQVGQNLIKH